MDREIKTVMENIECYQEIDGSQRIDYKNLLLLTNKEIEQLNIVTEYQDDKNLDNMVERGTAQEK